MTAFATLEEAAAAGYLTTTANRGSFTAPGIDAEVLARVEGPGIRVRVTGSNKEEALDSALKSLNDTLEQKRRHLGTHWGSRR